MLSITSTRWPILRMRSCSRAWAAVGFSFGAFSSAQKYCLVALPDGRVQSFG